MSLFFIHPIYLYGLAATSIPLLIHLLNRRKLKRIRFPAVRFVLLSQRRISRTYRLRHWILLALRTFAVFVLVLLLAHPIFQTGVGISTGGAPLSVAVILDNSLSMMWSREGDGFKQAKEALRRLIASLRDGDRATVLPTNRVEKGQTRLKSERPLLLRELDGIQIAAGTADFSAPLSEAYRLLKEPSPQKEIWLVTDLALTGWDRFRVSSLKQVDPLVPLRIIKVGNRGEPLNATIKEVKMRGQGVGVELPIHLEASIVNFGDKEIKDLLVQLHIDDQNRDQKLVSLPPKGEREVSFHFSLAQPGAHHGAVSIKKEGLAGNPASYFTLQVQDKFKVLVVDGDPQTALVQSESFFLTRALNPSGAGDTSLFLPTVVIPEGLNSVSLDSYQALIFCNVRAISDAILPKLIDYLRRGGGLLFFLGDHVQMDDYNLKLFQSSPPILPARITGKRNLPEPQAERIEKVDATHPALRGLSDQLIKESLRSTRIKAYFRVEMADPPTLLTLANGDPLLMEKRIGSGRVMLFTTAADRDWSDLPLKTAYLPLVQSLLSYLSGGKRGMIDAGIEVGNPKSFSFPSSYVGKSLRIIKPDGREGEITLVADREKASASFQENNVAGIYRLRLPATAEGDGTASPVYPVPQDAPNANESMNVLNFPEGKHPKAADVSPWYGVYSANSPFLESRLETIGEQDLKARLRPVRTEVIPIETLEKGGRKIDLSIPLLLLAIATLVSEGWLGQRF